jgi:uncharacterized protein YjiS (DUF1127 family)
MLHQTWFVPHSQVRSCRPTRRTAITIAVLPRWLTALRRMHERWCQRRDLRELDDHLLRDIGITRKQAQHETGKPFWK